jgi:hypothetical protein
MLPKRNNLFMFISSFNISYYIYERMKKVLFICKRRPSQYGISYGLVNSCQFLINALRDIGVNSKLVEVVDNNAIDHEVFLYKPTHVFIEALWVVPEKFHELVPLYPNVQWHVRLHSNIPFISNEGIAMEWIKKYLHLQEEYPNFHIASNSLVMVEELERVFNKDIVYAPNIYQPNLSEVTLNEPHKKHRIVDIGCFGAIRPLKNQLIQSMAAIAFANELGVILHFHINSFIWLQYNNHELSGENIYRNLVSLFKKSKHKLIVHDWVQHPDFMKLVKSMDLGLQVSFSETFNIVAADFVHLHVPVVGSNEITWLSSLYQAKPTDMDNIIYHMKLAWIGRKINLQVVNNWTLNEYNKISKEVWKNYLEV